MQDLAGCSKMHCPYEEAMLARAVRFQAIYYITAINAIPESQLLSNLLDHL